MDKRTTIIMSQTMLPPLVLESEEERTLFEQGRQRRLTRQR